MFNDNPQSKLTSLSKQQNSKTTTEANKPADSVGPPAKQKATSGKPDTTPISHPPLKGHPKANEEGKQLKQEEGSSPGFAERMMAKLMSGVSSKGDESQSSNKKAGTDNPPVEGSNDTYPAERTKPTQKKPTQVTPNIPTHTSPPNVARPKPGTPSFSGKRPTMPKFKGFNK